MSAPRAFGQEVDVNSMSNRAITSEKSADEEAARPALPHATSDAVYSEDINGFESDKLALFVNTVSHLERESAWLFARMETMAEELASADSSISPASSVSITPASVASDRSGEGEEVTIRAQAEKIAELELRLAVATQENSSLEQKLEHANFEIATLRQQAEETEAAKVTAERTAVQWMQRCQEIEAEMADLTSLNEELCANVEVMEDTLTQVGGLLGVCTVRDSLAEEVLALRRELAEVAQDRDASKAAFESTRIKLDDTVKKFKDELSYAEDELESLEKVLNVAVYVVDTHVKTCKADPGGLLGMLLPQLKGALPDSAYSVTAADIEVDVSASTWG